MVGAGPEQHNTKRPKFSCHFWAAGSKSSILRVPSTPNRTKGLEDHLHHPSSPTHQPFLPLIPFKGLALPHQGLASKGTCYLFSLPAAASRRILLEILGWSLISFYWLKSPRTQLGNVLALPTTLLSCPVAPAQRSLGCSPKHPPQACMDSSVPIWFSTTHTSLGRREGNRRCWLDWRLLLTPPPSEPC